MEAVVNAERILLLGRELYDAFKTVEKVQRVLEEIDRGLAKQTSFEEDIRLLKGIEEKLLEEARKLFVLLQSLEDIGGLYHRTEQNIEENLDIYWKHQ